jgi:hypothetical protein
MGYYVAMSSVMTRIVQQEMVALKTAILKLAGFAVLMVYFQYALQTVATLVAVGMEYVEGHQILGWSQHQHASDLCLTHTNSTETNITLY